MVVGLRSETMYLLIDTIVHNVSTRLARNELNVDDTRLDVLYTTGPTRLHGCHSQLGLPRRTTRTRASRFPTETKLSCTMSQAATPPGKSYSTGPLLTRRAV